MLPFPHISELDKRPTDGVVLAAPGFCKRADRAVCQKHYEHCRKKPGLHVCPFGYTTYVPKETDKPITTGIQVSGYFDRSKTSKRGSDGAFSVTFPQESFLEMAGRIYSDIVMQTDVEKSKARFDSLNKSLELQIEDANKLSHEVRNFNRDIKSSVEEINLHLNSVPNPDPGYLLERSETIFALSSLISTRLTIVDLSAGQNVIIGTKKRSQSIHAKFHKARQCLRGWALRNNGKAIELVGNSYRELDMLPVFDLLPFILIENAIKYAPPNETVTVSFDEGSSRLVVQVASLGPKVYDDEVGKLGKQRFRSRVAETVDSTGSGRGLVLAMQLADIHGLKLSFRSGAVTREVNGAPYADFTCDLMFP